jgi:uncharacterized protein (DUF2384 family)
MWSWNMKIGRNDPCPCGSGKKYKRCCLSVQSAAEDAPADPTWRRLRALLNGHANEMLRFIGKAYGPSAMLEAWDVFGGGDELDPRSPLMQLFVSWFLHCWAPDQHDTEVLDKSLHGVVPTSAYLAAKGRRLDPLLRRYLESVLAAPFSFFEVLACDPGSGMTLRNVMTKEEHAVAERSASLGMQRGDLLFGQLASVDRLTLLEACNGFAISPGEKAGIVTLRAHIASTCPAITHEILREWDLELIDLFHVISHRALNPPLPILQNTDGEPISPHRLMFELTTPPQAAFDALKHLAMDEEDEDMLADARRDADGNLTGARFNWKKLGNKVHAEWDNTVLGTIEIDGTRLVAEVNSQARAEAVRARIETALGHEVRHVATDVRSPDELLARLRPSAEGDGYTMGEDSNSRAAREESERLARLPEVREKLSQMLAGHWDSWVEKPLPVLGNRTPMDAVQDADWREIVESLVIEGERLADRMDMPTDPAVFRRLRTRLGLMENASQST